MCRVAADLPDGCRLAVDGPRWAAAEVCDAIVAGLRNRGRPVVLIDTEDFLQPASLRFERGRGDPDAYYEDRLNLAALRREVLEPLGPGGSRRYLPTLWDVDRDRATRATYQTAPAGAVAVVLGELLLGRGLPFDVVVHVAVSPAARRRQVRPEQASCVLPAHDRYDAAVRPGEIADIVIRADDPRHLAMSRRPRR